MQRCFLIMLAWAGCATTTTNNDTTFRDQFPTRTTLEKIAATPRPTKLANDPGVPSERWQLTGPLPEAIEPIVYSDSSPWQRWLDSVRAQRPDLTTPASLQCVSRETGRYFLARQALPDERLRAFIAARCGAFAGEVTVSYLTGNVIGRPSDEALFAQAEPQLAQQVKRLVDGGARELGIWLGHDDKHAVIMLSGDLPGARLAPTALVPAPDGNITITGQLITPNDHIEAIVNRGHFGFARCSVDPTVSLPRFMVRCPVDTSDQLAWLEVAAFPEGRVLGRVVARLLVWPSGSPTATYEQAGYVHRTLPAGPEPRRQLLELLNGVRAEASLPTVTLAERESIVADQVAPHYFAALAGSEPELVADQIVLGLRAGWEVEGDLAHGDFAYGMITASDDLGRLLDTVLERPAAREALLDRNVAAVALGIVMAAEQQLVGLVAGSYQLTRPINPASEAQRVAGRLTKSRIDARLPPRPSRS
jgi:hypothetical protein